MFKNNKKLGSWVLGVISIAIALSWILTQVFIYQPKLNKLANIYRDFAVVEDYYEVVDIAESIPLPNPLGPIKNLDYSPVTVYEAIPNSTAVDFRGSSYGYVLKLSTGLNTYLATSDSESSARETVVYTIGQLRENRLRLRWFVYNGPIPPPEWIQTSK
jgi:hypothetical protein